ncbi:MAG TPA: DUF929 family protein [Candidatus Dormibacteraeota bacterium]|jgi:thiol-disulfide isomerase/thioredoxin|nr:DUF929 family protein [Candidatus Dormibacteraeota bacterium]
MAKQRARPTSTKARTRSQRPPRPKQQQTKNTSYKGRPRPWWSSPWLIAGTIGLLIVIVLGIALYSYVNSQNQAPKVSGTTTSRVINLATHVPSSAYDEVPALAPGAQTASFQSTSATPAAGTQPYVLYIGAEYCPYCAAERWALVAALSRFGNFSGLKLTDSSSTDVYPNTPTFTFLDSNYSSSYISFQSKEVEDRNQQPLQTLTPQQEQLESKYNAQGSIPFILIDNRWVQVGPAYEPTSLDGKSWSQIASDLSNPNAASTKAILGEANIISAAICESNGGKPASVCQSSGVQAAMKQLPASK